MFDVLCDVDTFDGGFTYFLSFGMPLCICCELLRSYGYQAFFALSRLATCRDRN